MLRPGSARRIAILVYFRSEHGGLHDHVADQVTFARALGYEVTVVCPPGTFADCLAGQADVVATDFMDPADVVDRIIRMGTPHLIHSHPGRARETAFALKAATSAPLVVTYHGSRPETLSAADPQIDVAITVSDLTRRFIIKRTDINPSRVIVIPNAVDTSVFAIADSPPPDPAVVLLASRWDDDKGFVVDVALEALRDLGASADLAHVDVVVAGDGSRLGELEHVCAQVNEARERDSFRSAGWLSPEALAQHMGAASVVVSPGRGAVQAMAVGRPTIALGSKGYVVFLDAQGLLKGMDVNFGSGGIGPRAYPAGLIQRDIRRALEHAHDEDLRSAYRYVVQDRTMSAVQDAHALVWSIALA